MAGWEEQKCTRPSELSGSALENLKTARILLTWHPTAALLVDHPTQPNQFALALHLHTNTIENHCNMLGRRSWLRVKILPRWRVPLARAHFDTSAPAFCQRTSTCPIQQHADTRSIKLSTTYLLFSRHNSQCLAGQYICCISL